MVHFRKVFNTNSKLFWFPSHQVLTTTNTKGNALKQLENGIHAIDYIIEVRDARIPTSCINPKFSQMLRRKRLIVYNKMDLCDASTIPIVRDAFKERGEDVVFTCNLKKKSIQEILNKAIGNLFFLKL